MTTKRQFPLLAVAYGLTFCACSFNVIAPPARLGFAESPKVTQEGKTKFSVEGMGGGKVFGPEILAGTLRISRGISGNREVNFRPVLGVVNEDHQFHQDNSFFGAALDLKKQVNSPEDWWAASAWGGGGYLYSSFGDIFSGHGGLAIGKESHWFRPFVSTDIFFDIPARTKPIRGDAGDEPMEKRLTTTVGVKAAMGLKLQLHPRFALVSAGSIGTARSETDHINFLMVGQSVELGF